MANADLQDIAARLNALNNDDLQRLRAILPGVFAAAPPPAVPPAAGFQHQPELPQNLNEPYSIDEWMSTSTAQLERAYPDFIPLHRDFRLGFGDRGSEESESSVNKIIEGLRGFHQRKAQRLVQLHHHPQTARAPPICIQPIAIYGAEREGKTSAQFGAQRAALDMGFATVVFVAPTKIAPVVDMHTKLHEAGFPNIKSTVPDSKLPPEITSDTNYPRILVCAANNPADIRKAGEFIRSNLRRGILTVGFVDECDELVMGKPSQSAQTLECTELNDDGEEVPVTYEDLAKSEALFRQLVQPFAMLFLITATYTGTHLKKCKFFIDEEPAVFIRVRKSLQYAGINNIRCHIELPEKTNTSTSKLEDLFETDKPLDLMLQSFARRENPSDYSMLTSWLPEDDPQRPSNVQLRGTMFVSLNQLVHAANGAYDWCRHICRRLMELLKEIQAEPHLPGNKPLLICFVGKPCAFTCDNRGGLLKLEMQSGMTLKKMVARAVEHWGEYRFSHTAIVGYNLTRRAMTATYELGGYLHTPMYAMVCFPAAGKLDSDSQRLLRVGHDFGAYIMPEGYCILAACEKGKLERLKAYRSLEERSFERQEQEPVTMAEFRDKMPVRELGLDGHFLTKRKLSMGDLGQQEPRAKRKRNYEALSIPFSNYLNYGIDLAESTIDNYVGAINRIMQENPLNVILFGDFASLNEIRNNDHNRDRAAVMKFRQFYQSERYMPQDLREQIEEDDY